MLSILLFSSSPAWSEWYWNIGYRNPHTATFGANFMYLWTQLAFEIGVGALDISSNDSSDTNNTDDNSTSLRVGGGFNLKYLFGSGVFRPYLQGGFGLASGLSTGDDLGASAGASGPFAGGGIFLLGNPFHVYASINLSGSQTFFQGGLGFGF